MSVWINLVMYELLTKDLPPSHGGISFMILEYQCLHGPFTKKELIKHIGKKLYKYWPRIEPLLTKVSANTYICPWLYIDENGIDE